MMKITNHASLTLKNFTLRIAPGEYQSFPVVDNKGKFPHFYETQSLETEILKLTPEENFIYGIYKRYGNFNVLVCAFSTRDEINNEAMGIINQSSNFKLALKNLLGDKNEH